MKRLITAAAAGLLMLSAGALHAECLFPGSEIDIPDGSKASKEEMIAAIKKLKDLQAEMEAFRTCLDDELDSLDQPPEPVAVQFHDLRYNATITTEEELANKLNEEIRAFKARGTE